MSVFVCLADCQVYRSSTRNSFQMKDTLSSAIHGLRESTQIDHIVSFTTSTKKPISRYAADERYIEQSNFPPLDESLN